MRITAESNAHDIAADFGRIAAEAVAAVTAAVEEGGNEVRDLWREGAERTAGKHGKHYPKSIESTMRPGLAAIVAEVAPAEGMEQAGMSFEFGSRNQPPHLDGQHARDAAEPSVVRRIDAAITGAIQ